jgi:hypothetical protein
MFKVGQKVVCVNNRPIEYNFYNESLAKLKEKEIYTIEGFTSTGILLKEVKSSHTDVGYNASRFHKVEYFENVKVSSNEWLGNIKVRLPKLREARDKRLKEQSERRKFEELSMKYGQ